MIQKIKTFLQTEYAKALSDRKTEKASVSQRAGKLLILFFAGMLIFTIVSRAAASITVAKVILENPIRDRVIYNLSGTGEITVSKEAYLPVLPGYRIDHVYVSAGESVGSGTVLFSYSTEDLQEKYDFIGTEIEKMKLLISQEELKLPAEEASEASKLALQQAEDNLRIARANLSEAEKDYEESYLNTKDELLINKRKEYAGALKNYETVLLSQEKQLKQSQRAMEDAMTSWLKANETAEQFMQAIGNYKTAVVSKEDGPVYFAQEALLEAYYGSPEAYSEHKEAVFNAALTMTGDGEYLWYLRNILSYYEGELFAAYEELQFAGSSTDPTVRSKDNINKLTDKYNDILWYYLTNLGEYEMQLEPLESVLTKESSELKRLRRNDKLLKEYLAAYKASIGGSQEEAAQKKLYDFLLGERAETIERNIASGALALTRAEEDHEMLKSEIEIVRSDLQAELTELKNTIESMENGTFDFEAALEGKKQAIKSAKEAVRLAGQAAEASRLQYETAGYQSSRQISELVLRGYHIDMEQKEQEQEEIGTLLERSGEVLSPYEGVISSLGLEEGGMTMGNEMVKIGMGDYLFKAVFDREKAVNVEAGSKITVTLPGEERGTETEIDQISVNRDGMSEFLAKLPKKDYFLGEKAGFRITTQSEQFDLCIPIQALRRDNYGYFILTVREQEDILGTQLIADRVKVEVLERGDSTVAVDGPLSRNDQVITGSSKYVGAGDKVRNN